MSTGALRIARLIAFTGLQLLFAAQVHAQATRTWVSGVGDDANPCSRTAPCKTFAGAISKTQAGGEISALDPAGFGAVTITKSITINGDGTLASILASLTNGIVVNAGVNDVVTIRNISINGAGNGLNGIRFIAGGELHVEGVKIYGFLQRGIHFNPSGASSLFVSSSSFRNNAGGGIHVQPQATGSAVAVLNEVVMHGNFWGLRAEDNASVMVRNSIASGNDQDGIAAFSNAAAVDISLENTTASHNTQVGVHASGALGGIRISEVMAVRNDVGIQADAGSSIVSFGNNRVRGNLSVNGVPSATPGQM